MTLTPERAERRLLPLLPVARPGRRHGSRSYATCHYKCGDACDKPEPNKTGHQHVSDVIEAAIARRTLLQGAAAGSAVVVGGVAAGSRAAAGPATAPAGTGRNAAVGNWPPVPPNNLDEVTVPPGYRSRLVIAWGDPVEKRAPAFDAANQTPASAAAQFGYNNDYVGVLPLDRYSSLLVTNHEYTNEELMFPAGVYDDATIKRIAIQSHGMSVVEVERPRNRRSGAWFRRKPSQTTHNRRITGSTPFRLDGPAVGDPRLSTSADPAGRNPLGTLNNCAGGMTPWGTVLSGEENFNQYFDVTGERDPRYVESYDRYGITGEDTKGWSEVDDRFDLSAEPHEPFRFGWIVEVDPYDPFSTPRKHTMLGRFKHEGANIAVADDGRVVAYMGDDERGDYLYKFVSKERHNSAAGKAARRHNLSLLSTGTLYVARLTGDGGAVGADGNFEAADSEYDGTGVWIPLTSDTRSFVPGMSVADVLIDTRLAADLVAPTRMDRPEDVEPHPTNGRVYAALTNNRNRGVDYPVDEANPIAANRHGYVLEILPSGGHASRRFTWTLLLVCGDPESAETYFAGYPKDRVSPISCPDNVAFDSRGNLWVATDGNQLGSNDGLFRVPLRGSERGHVEQFLTVAVDAETCGPLLTNGDRTVWVAVQHPGENDGSTHENPTSTWPGTHSFPRPGVVVTWKRF